MVSVSVICTFHSEKYLAINTLTSIGKSRDYAISKGMNVELVIVMDNIDPLTERIINTHSSIRNVDKKIKTFNGSPGLSRNDGVAISKGDYIVITDGDDYYSENFIYNTVSLVKQNHKHIAFPEFEVAFDQKSYYYFYLDFDNNEFNTFNLMEIHPLSSSCAGIRELFLSHPQIAISSGIGHEDWHFNCEAIASGYIPKSCKNSYRFYRCKKSSESVCLRMEAKNAIISSSNLFNMYPRLKKQNKLQHNNKLSIEQKRSLVKNACNEMSLIDSSLISCDVTKIPEYKPNLSDAVGLAFAELFDPKLRKCSEIYILSELNEKNAMFQDISTALNNNKKIMLIATNQQVAQKFAILSGDVTLLPCYKFKNKLLHSQMLLLMARLVIQLNPNRTYIADSVYGKKLYSIYGDAMKQSTDLVDKIDNNIIYLCFSSSDLYAKYLGVTIASILKNSNRDDKYNITVLDDGISEEKKQILISLKSIKNFEIDFIKINKEDFSDCPMTPDANHIALPTYYRFKIPSYCSHLDKVLYLDCDIIVKNSLKELWDTDITDYYFAGVTDVYDSSSMKRLELNHCYVNAGVMLINNKKWKEDNIEYRLFDYVVHNFHKILWLDQDVINVVLQDKIKVMNEKWNYQYSVQYNANEVSRHPEYFTTPLKNPNIIHFVGSDKPWNEGSMAIFKDEYWKYLKLTPWNSEYRSPNKGVLKVKIKKVLKKIIKKSVLFLTKITFTEKYVRRCWDIYKEFPNMNIRIDALNHQVQSFYDEKQRINNAFGWLGDLENKYVALSERLDQTEQKLSALVERLEQTEQKQENALSFTSDLEQKLYGLGEHADNIDVRIDNVLSHIDKSVVVASLHQQVFPKFKGINSGRDVVVVGTGPSLNNYVAYKDAIHIGVNRAFKYDAINFDYLFAIDYYGTKPYQSQIDEYNPDSCIKFYGIMDNYHEMNIPEIHANKAKAYRYYINENTTSERFNQDISFSPLASFWSVIFQAVHFALYTHPKRLYIVGCDESRKGYFDGEKQLDNFLNDGGEHYTKHMEGWRQLKKFAEIYYPDVEIISINPVGLRGLFKDVYTEENNSNGDSFTRNYYVNQYRLMHSQSEEYGSSSIAYLPEIELFINYLNAKSVLDYGCGKGVLIKTLKESYHDIRICGYDPAIPEISIVPSGAFDLVINTDCLEHIPEEMIPSIIEEISKISDKTVFILHHAPAKLLLPNGENAHCTVKPPEWYHEIMKKYFQVVTPLKGRAPFLSAVATFTVPEEIKRKYDTFVANGLPW